MELYSKKKLCNVYAYNKADIIAAIDDVLYLSNWSNNLIIDKKTNAYKYFQKEAFDQFQ